MSLFRENLSKKISINKLFNNVFQSIQLLEDYGKIDIESMRELLIFSAWFYTEERGLSLYLDGTKEKYSRILVLDNDLSIYKTTIKDVLLRKKPTLKEMLNIKNALNILNDSDVFVSKREDSLKIIRNLSISLLDISFSENDINQIVYQGEYSFKSGDFDKIEEVLVLFAELLGFICAPNIFSMRDYKIWGILREKYKGDYFFGPMVVLNIIDNSIFYIKNIFSVCDNDRFITLKSIMSGSLEGILSTNKDVFSFLKKEVMKGQLKQKS